MRAVETAWLYVALISCAAGIVLALYLLAARVKVQRQRSREEMRRHVQDAA